MSGRVSRRAVLKGGAAIAGTTAVTGFPMVWAQNLKDVTLNHTGMSYSTLRRHRASRPSKDLGFKVEMSVVDHPGLLNRIVNDPKSIDIADIEIWQTKVAVPQGVTQARRDRQDQGLGRADDALYGGHVRRQGGVAPGRLADRVHVPRRARGKTASSAAKTEWANFVPGVYNADTLGIRPDLVGREITSWADLISPDFKGKTAIQNIPTNGIMDAMMAFESAGVLKYGDKGNPDPGGARPDTIAQADRAQEGRPFPCAVEHLRRDAST